ncbi:MAG: VRR-NUC domain-containing protein [Lachnospirales bacterium]
MTTNKQEKRYPLESVEQKLLFEWAKVVSNKHKELNLMYAVPNGGSRNRIEAANLKKQGVKAGVPDICLPVARNGFNGLYIELKRQKGSRTSPEQKEWIEQLEQQGYKAVICFGFDEGKKVLEEYLGI